MHWVRMLALALALACTSAPGLHAAEPDYPAFDASMDATAAVDAALARSAQRGTLVMIVLGANWCHDSRSFARRIQSKRFAQMMSDWYEVVFVNVGKPQTGDGHNLHIAERFGVRSIEGTPTVLIVDRDSELLNAGSAKSWRNAASRSDNEIFEELALTTTTEIARD